MGQWLSVWWLYSRKAGNHLQRGQPFASAVIQEQRLILFIFWWKSSIVGIYPMKFWKPSSLSNKYWTDNFVKKKKEIFIVYQLTLFIPCSINLHDFTLLLICSCMSPTPVCASYLSCFLLWWRRTVMTRVSPCQGSLLRVNVQHAIPV